MAKVLDWAVILVVRELSTVKMLQYNSTENEQCLTNKKNNMIGHITTNLLNLFYLLLNC